MCAAADCNSAVTPDFTSWQQSMPPLLCAGPASRAEVLRPACCVAFSLAFAQHSARQLHVHPTTGLANAAADAKAVVARSWPLGYRLQRPGAAVGIPPGTANCHASLKVQVCRAGAAQRALRPHAAWPGMQVLQRRQQAVRPHSYHASSCSEHCMQAAGCTKCCRFSGL